MHERLKETAKPKQYFKSIENNALLQNMKCFALFNKLLQ